ncbi:hypothetical protein KUTeg_018062 [Tegillarca granosa]|uniref:Immunoglobulin-like beta-sandwich domain-containing protein n=1 Tax=Tegillarca granosa TaxID=220873 RepID=A0ABQ9EGR6_TEGGR|nr:hypothetical protein KUTeg_018062 [Tegillarca granosa]
MNEAHLLQQKVFNIERSQMTNGSRSNKKRNGRGYAAKMPTIITRETNYTYSTGKLAVIWRRADYPNPLTIGKFTYVGDSRIQVHHVVHKDQWNLHIRNASKKDEGVYECQVSTSDRSIRKNFLLTINDDPSPGK